MGTLIKKSSLVMQGWNTVDTDDDRELWHHDRLNMRKVPVVETLGDGTWLECKVTFVKGKFIVDTIEDLYRTLEFFGLIEPEPITVEGLLAMGFTADGRVYYRMGSEIGDNLVASVEFVVTERDAELVPCATLEIKGIKNLSIPFTSCKTMKDLRDLCRLMGVKND